MDYYLSRGLLAFASLLFTDGQTANNHQSCTTVFSKTLDTTLIIMASVQVFAILAYVLKHGISFLTQHC